MSEIRQTALLSMKIILGFCLWLMICLGGSPVLAASPSMADARQAYFDARGGGRDLDGAVAIIDSVLQTNTENSMAQVYKGSLRTMQAGKAIAPWQKMRYMAEGLELLDKGMAQMGSLTAKMPGDILLEALLISGITNASIPRSYGRVSVAKRDLTSAVAMADFSRLPAKTKATVYAWLSVLLRSEQAGQAQRYMELARSLDRASADEIGTKR